MNYGQPPSYSGQNRLRPRNNVLQALSRRRQQSPGQQVARQGVQRMPGISRQAQMGMQRERLNGGQHLFAEFHQLQSLTHPDKPQGGDYTIPAKALARRKALHSLLVTRFGNNKPTYGTGQTYGAPKPPRYGPQR